MSLHQSDYINLGKTILGNVLDNPNVVMQSVPVAHQARAVSLLNMLYGLLHILDGMPVQTPSTATPSVTAPVTTSTEEENTGSAIVGYPAS